ncbi:MAG: gloB [Verrucomicrobiales bacterium]|nr:gloB [Verrucomicrobiales bacterium]
MAQLPLEDNFNDIIAKAQKGFKLSDMALAAATRTTVDDLNKLKSGEMNEPLVRRIGPIMNLDVGKLLELGNKSWYPPEHKVPGLVMFTTTYQDMTVNNYLVYDQLTQKAVVFDTGADITELVKHCLANRLKIKFIFLTHTHVDHIAELERLKQKSGAPAYVCELEAFAGAEPFKAGKVFDLSNMEIETRLTCGHAKGGITYVIHGLQKPVAIVGDAIFCCSMGGGMVSYVDALRTNRQQIFSLPDNTILCPGHGPLTTVAEQKVHNPFFPEYKQNASRPA